MISIVVDPTTLPFTDARMVTKPGAAAPGENVAVETPSALAGSTLLKMPTGAHDAVTAE